MGQGQKPSQSVCGGRGGGGYISGVFSYKRDREIVLITGVHISEVFTDIKHTPLNGCINLNPTVDML